MNFIFCLFSSLSHKSCSFMFIYLVIKADFAKFQWSIAKLSLFVYEICAYPSLSLSLSPINNQTHEDTDCIGQHIPLYFTIILTIVTVGCESVSNILLARFICFVVGYFGLKSISKYENKKYLSTQWLSLSCIFI